MAVKVTCMEHEWRCKFHTPAPAFRRASTPVCADCVWKCRSALAFSFERARPQKDMPFLRPNFGPASRSSSVFIFRNKSSSVSPLSLCIGVVCGVGCPAAGGQIPPSSVLPSTSPRTHLCLMQPLRAGSRASTLWLSHSHQRIAVCPRRSYRLGLALQGMAGTMSPIHDYSCASYTVGLM